MYGRVPVTELIDGTGVANETDGVRTRRRWKRREKTKGSKTGERQLEEVIIEGKGKKRKVNGLPITPPMSSPKARLKPTTYQSTLITPNATKLCSMVEITFLGLTMPP